MYIIIAFQGIEIEGKMKPHTLEKLSKTSFANVQVPTPRILPECTLKYPSKSIGVLQANPAQTFAYCGYLRFKKMTPIIVRKFKPSPTLK